MNVLFSMPCVERFRQIPRVAYATTTTPKSPYSMIVERKPLWNLCSLMISFSRPENRTSTQSIFSNSGYCSNLELPSSRRVSLGTTAIIATSAAASMKREKRKKRVNKNKLENTRDNALPVSTTANAVQHTKNVRALLRSFCQSCVSRKTSCNRIQ